MKNFRINIIIRTILLSLSIFLLFYFYFTTELTATLIILALLILFQIITLINKIETTNKELTRFLLSIKYSDFSQAFINKGLGSTFNELNKAFNEVILEFQKTRNEKEENHRYLQTVMQHVGAGLISFTSDGKVDFINNAAKRILKITYLNNIEALDKISPGLGKTFMQLKTGERTTIKIFQDDFIQLLVNAAEFKLRSKQYTLTSIQNIQSELEETEMDAWQKLIRVLTHEIMNSVTPISSLAATVNIMIKNNQDISNKDNIEDITSALNTIQKRSDGLLHFVDSYRSLTKVPKPNFQIFPLKDMFTNIHKLLESDFKERGIEFNYSIEPADINITADQELIEQVIINLILNSMQALSICENKKIFLKASLDERGKTLIKVADNGPGIESDLMDKIFIPFFTTKKEGSGIGLSLSRQIVRMHGGNIRVQSKPGEETVFTIKL